MTTMAVRRVDLSEQLAQKIKDREVTGQGGFQELAKALKKRLSGRSLEIDDDFKERIEHYAFDYGSGGWQTFLREIVSEIEQTPDVQ